MSVMSVGSGGLAVGVAAAQGTAAQRHACMSDAMSLCASEIPNADRIAACLRREHTRVSPACLNEMDVPTQSASLKR